MSGHVGDLSPQQEQGLTQFKEAVAAFTGKPDDSDQYYLRWLRAKNFNVEKSVEMFGKHLDWRKEYNVESVSEWTPPEVLQKYYPGGLLGEDKEGYPVYYDFVGNLDMKGIAMSVKVEDLIKLRISQMERANLVLKQTSERLGRPIDGVTLVMNLENLSYQQQMSWISIQTTREIFKVLNENYPERTKAIYVINAPRIFPVVFNVFKRFMDENTKKKIAVLGSNWKEELQQHISPDQLPQAYGGTRCEPDPKCTEYLNWGGQVPDQYYMTNTLKGKEDLKQTNVKSGATLNVDVEVDVTGTTISWEFMTTGYDIGFGLYHKPTEMRNKKVNVGDMTVVVSSQKVNSHEIPQSGEHQCDHTGSYVLRFDNTYSWTRSKELFYAIRVLPPDTEPVCKQEENDEEEVKEPDVAEMTQNEES